MSGEDRVDAEIRRADPLRSGPARLDPELIERIVAAGPRRRSAGRRPVVLAVAAATVAVVLGAFAVVRPVGPEAVPPAGPPAPAATTPPAPPSPSPSGSCRTTGWKARSLPAGYRPSDPVSARERGWAAEWERPNSTTQVVLRVYCGTLGEGELVPKRPNFRVGAYPARRDPGPGALWLSVQREGGVILELSTYDPGAAPQAVVVAIAAALTDDPAVPDPSAPADACSTVLPAWRFETPAGFRPESATKDGSGSRLFRYRRGATVVSISVSCPGAVDFAPGRQPAPVPFGKAVYVVSGTQLAVVWQARPQLALLIETAPPAGTRADLLAFVAAARER